MSKKQEPKKDVDVLSVIHNVDAEELRKRKLEAIKASVGDDADSLAEALLATAEKLELQQERSKVESIRPTISISTDPKRVTPTMQYGWLTISVGEGEDRMDLIDIECHWLLRDTDSGRPSIVYLAQDEMVRGYILGKHKGNLEALTKLSSAQGGYGLAADASKEDVDRAVASLKKGVERCERDANSRFGPRQPIVRLNPSLVEGQKQAGLEIRGSRRS